MLKKSSKLDILFGMGKWGLLFWPVVFLAICGLVFYMVVPFDNKSFVSSPSPVVLSPVMDYSVKHSLPSVSVVSVKRVPDDFENTGYAIVDGKRYELVNGRYVEKNSDIGSKTEEK